MKNETPKQPPHTALSLLLVPVAFLVWTSIFCVSFAFSTRSIEQDTNEIAKSYARAAIDKDVLIRAWAAKHVPVYVPISDETPPNVHLADREERDIVSGNGTQLTMVNPAYLIRQLHELGRGRGHEFGHGHMTSLQPINPSNAPDPWEHDALVALAAGATEVSSIETLEGERQMRLMQPLFVEESCLNCHDRATNPLGAIRGGIVSNIHLADLLDRAEARLRNTLVVHLGLWLVGVLGLLLAGRALLKSERRRKRSEVARAEAEHNHLQILHQDAQAREAMIELLMDSTDTYEEDLVEVEKQHHNMLEAQEHLLDVNTRLETLATTDALTSLFNRRKGRDLLDHEWERVLRGGQDLGVIMMDIDHFKRVNDTHGHGAGDDVLREVATRIHSTIYTQDSAVRWGGEEMLIICPNSSTDDAAVLAERLRKAIKDRPFVVGAETLLEVSASFGVASCRSDQIISIEALVERADEALYRAKETGRNKVCTSPGGEPTPCMAAPAGADPCVVHS